MWMRPLLTAANEGASLPHPSHVPFEVVLHAITVGTPHLMLQWFQVVLYGNKWHAVVVTQAQQGGKTYNKTKLLLRLCSS